MTAVFPLKPSLPYKQTLEWITDVMESYDGEEQRVRVRHAPRSIFDLRAYARTSAQAAKAKAMLTLYQDEVVALPAWHDATALSGVSSGVGSVTVDTTECEYYADAFAVLWEDEDTFELLEIESVAADSVSFKTNTTQAYGSGVLVMPAFEAVLRESIEYSDGDYDKAEFKLLLTTINNNVLPPADWSATTYGGIPVMDNPLLLGDGRMVGRSLIRPIVMVDGGTGPIQVFSRTDHPETETKDYRWVVEGRTNIWAFRRWLSEMAGRVGTVWIPTWTKDVVLTGGFGQSDLTLYIESYGYNTDDSFAHLAFVKTDGTILCRAVSGWAANTVTIDSGLGFAGTMADFDRISFLRLHRLATDSVEINWLRNDLLECSIPIRSVPA